MRINQEIDQFVLITPQGPNVDNVVLCCHGGRTIEAFLCIWILRSFKSSSLVISLYLLKECKTLVLKKNSSLADDYQKI